MKMITLALFSLLSFNVFSHCPIDFPEANLCGNITWIEGPHLNTTSQFELVFWEKGDHNHVHVSPDFDLNIYTWMVMDSGMNHGGPAITYTEVSEGVFEVLDARFFMHGMQGHWEVRIELNEAGQTISLGSDIVPLEGDSDGDHDHGGHHN